MTETGIRTVVLEEIKDIARKYGVKKVLLFGSEQEETFIKQAILIWQFPVETRQCFNLMWRRKLLHY